MREKGRNDGERSARRKQNNRPERNCARAGGYGGTKRGRLCKGEKEMAAEGEGGKERDDIDRISVATDSIYPLLTGLLLRGFNFDSSCRVESSKIIGVTIVVGQYGVDFLSSRTCQDRISIRLVFFRQRPISRTSVNAPAFGKVSSRDEIKPLIRSKRAAAAVFSTHPFNSAFDTSARVP